MVATASAHDRVRLSESQLKQGGKAARKEKSLNGQTCAREGWKAGIHEVAGSNMAWRNL
jgi:hypothetical protein